jgi:carbon storage regulator
MLHMGRVKDPDAEARRFYEAQAREAVTAMLVLTRKSNQSIMIGDDIEVSVLAITGEKVRIGIHAPRDVPVYRKEVYVEIHEEGLAKARDDRDQVDAALG